MTPRTPSSLKYHQLRLDLPFEPYPVVEEMHGCSMDGIFAVSHLVLNSESI